MCRATSLILVKLALVSCVVSIRRRIASRSFIADAVFVGDVFTADLFAKLTMKICTLLVKHCHSSFRGTHCLGCAP